MIHADDPIHQYPPYTVTHAQKHTPDNGSGTEPEPGFSKEVFDINRRDFHWKIHWDGWFGGFPHNAHRLKKNIWKRDWALTTIIYPPVMMFLFYIPHWSGQLPQFSPSPRLWASQPQRGCPGDWGKIMGKRRFLSINYLQYHLSVSTVFDSLINRCK